MSTPKNNRALPNIAVSSREMNTFRTLTAISPPRRDAYDPNRKPHKPLRMHDSARFRPKSDVFYVLNDVDELEPAVSAVHPVGVQAPALQTASTDDETAPQERFKSFRKFLMKLRGLSTIFRSTKVPTFLARS